MKTTGKLQEAIKACAAEINSDLPDVWGWEDHVEDLIEKHLFSFFEAHEALREFLLAREAYAASNASTHTSAFERLQNAEKRALEIVRAQPAA